MPLEPSSLLVVSDTRVPAMKMLGITDLHVLRYNGLSLLEFKRVVDGFLRYALKHPETTFKISPIGAVEDIAPMFAFAPENCILPKRWESTLPYVEGRQFWVI